MSVKLQTGPRGGRFFMTDQGHKVYVSRFVSARTSKPDMVPKKPALPPKGSLIGTKTVVGKTHVKAWSEKRNRQYEHIEQSELARGASEEDARRIAAATVNKGRAMHGETKNPWL
jgi:hypothetical protein